MIARHQKASARKRDQSKLRNSNAERAASGRTFCSGPRPCGSSACSVRLPAFAEALVLVPLLLPLLLAISEPGPPSNLNAPLLLPLRAREHGKHGQRSASLDAAALACPDQTSSAPHARPHA